MPDNANVLSVRLMVDWAGEVYLDYTLPMLEVGMHITLPFNKAETPDDTSRIFTVQDIGYWGHLSPSLLIAYVYHADRERLTRDDFIASGWTPITH
jgi:hypothetical protein